MVNLSLTPRDRENPVSAKVLTTNLARNQSQPSTRSSAPQTKRAVRGGARLSALLQRITTKNTTTMASPAPEQAAGQVTQQYRELVQDSQRLAQKISELETDRNEHKLVEETLTPLDPSRKAYRLVGEVLVERTVQEVLPSVQANRANVSIDASHCVYLTSLHNQAQGTVRYSHAAFFSLLAARSNHYHTARAHGRQAKGSCGTQNQTQYQYGSTS